MKKNFLKIAALLIAAMLLVVSCSQEVAPKNEDNGLVDAKLNIAYGRDLTVSGAQEAEEFILEYTTEYQWTDGSGNGYTEGVEGEKTATLSNDGKLGWLTPGYWKITVNAFKKDAQTKAKTGNAIFSGSTSAYFTSKTSTATIFLEPVKSDDNSISFNFYMQDLGETYGEKSVENADFVVKYTISKNGSVVDGHNSVAFTKNEAKKVYKKADGSLTVEPTEDSVYDNQRCYTKTVDGLKSGYYTVTVAVYEVKDGQENLKGGITKGMLLAGNQATVGGHIEPSDYVKGTVSSYFIDVDTVLTATPVSYSEDKTKATVTYKLKDDTIIANYGKDLSGITRTYYWDFDGVLSQESNTPSDSNKEVTKPKEYTNPGQKNVSCTTIYSKTEGSNTYYWAETKSIQVEILAEKFSF